MRHNPALKSALVHSAMVRELKITVDSLNEFLRLDPPKVRTPYANEAHFVLAHGRLFEPIPFPKDLLTMRMPKGCFWNAHLLVKRFPKRFRYVEGFASIEGLHPIPTFHGWVIDEKDRAIDPTWDNGVEYFGVEFAREYVERNENADNDEHADPGWNSLLIGTAAILLGQHTEKDWKPKKTPNRALVKS